MHITIKVSRKNLLHGVSYNRVNEKTETVFPHPCAKQIPPSACLPHSQHSPYVCIEGRAGEQEARG